ncbi:DUF167 domain-containing protein [Candidatus Gracilibacteria bacterium]|nr:DUF167 domain-containing protein [Candidatus Gracilibacteria bacterium]
MWDNLENFFQVLEKELSRNGSFYFRAKIISGAEKSEFFSVLADKEQTIKIKIAAQPEKGKANKEIIRFLKKKFNAHIQIVSGHQHALKLIKLTSSK